MKRMTKTRLNFIRECLGGAAYLPPDKAMPELLDALVAEVAHTNELEATIRRAFQLLRDHRYGANEFGLVELDDLLESAVSEMVEASRCLVR